MRITSSVGRKFSVRSIAVYEKSSGKVLHICHWAAPQGAPSIPDADLEAQAIEFAKKHGHDVSNVGTTEVDANKLLTHRVRKVDQDASVLMEEMNESRVRKKQR